MTTMVKFRTEETLKSEVSSLFDSFGLNLFTAINIFLKQAVLKKCFPYPIDYEIAKDYACTYPKNFLDLFGAGKELGLDNEPNATSYEQDSKRESI